jgi:hypothetical protein
VRHVRNLTGAARILSKARIFLCQSFAYLSVVCQVPALLLDPLRSFGRSSPLDNLLDVACLSIVFCLMWSLQRWTQRRAQASAISSGRAHQRSTVRRENGSADYNASLNLRRCQLATRTDSAIRSPLNCYLRAFRSIESRFFLATAAFESLSVITRRGRVHAKSKSRPICGPLGATIP